MPQLRNPLENGTHLHQNLSTPNAIPAEPNKESSVTSYAVSPTDSTSSPTPSPSSADFDATLDVHSINGIDASPAVISDEKYELVVEQVDLTSTNSTSSLPPDGSTPAPIHANNRFAQLRSVVERQRQQQFEPVWRPSVVKVRPLLGLLALGLSIGRMFVSLAILLVSHGQPIRT